MASGGAGAMAPIPPGPPPPDPRCPNGATWELATVFSDESIDDHRIFAHGDTIWVTWVDAAGVHADSISPASSLFEGWTKTAPVISCAEECRHVASFDADGNGVVATAPSMMASHFDAAARLWTDELLFSSPTTADALCDATVAGASALVVWRDHTRTQSPNAPVYRAGLRRDGAWWPSQLTDGGGQDPICRAAVSLEPEPMVMFGMLSPEVGMHLHELGPRGWDRTRIGLGGISSDPQFGWTADVGLAMWHEQRPGGVSHILSSFLVDARPAWSPPLDLAMSNPSVFVRPFRMAMGNDGRGVAVWLMPESGLEAAWFDFATQSWDDPAVLDVDCRTTPDIAIDDEGNAFAVWSRDTTAQLVARRYDRDANQWGDVELVAEEGRTARIASTPDGIAAVAYATAALTGTRAKRRLCTE